MPPRVIEQFDAGASEDMLGQWTWAPTPDIQHVRTELEFLGYIRKKRVSDPTHERYPLTELGVSTIREWRNPTPVREELIGLGGRVYKR